MIAIVEIAGVQHKVSPAQKVFVPRLTEEVGKKLKFSKVLLLADDAGVKVGNPTIKGVSVEATVLRHAKDETVIVFKKKRRKGYRVRNGHRQQYTEVEITKIG